MSTVQDSPLFGRDRELAEVRRLFNDEQVRFLTLIGPGGTGKTRVAQTIAAESASQQGRAVHFVDLSGLEDARDVPATIAEALGAQESGAEPLLDILRRLLADTVALVVLDNFERVLGAAEFVSWLLTAAPGLTLLVTSREPLHIRAERVLPIAPLPVPDPGVTDLSAIRSMPSVGLFEDRGRRRRPDFVVSDANAATVAEICRRLDGLPLAIELAAAQVGVLSTAAVLARLQAQEPFVLGGARDLPSRQRTLAATVGWSFDLLTEDERVVFRRLAVFSSAFGLEAANAVVAGDGRVSRDVLSVLAHLADKSLLHPVEFASDEPRFRLLETIRTFGMNVLSEAGELTPIRRAHAAYFAQLAEEAERQLVGSSMGQVLDRLEREYDHFRSALTWTLDSPEVADLIVGLRIAGALHRFWMMRGRLGEARQWLERALSRGGAVPAEVRAKALNALGVLAGMAGDSDAAEAYFQESFDLWESLDDRIHMAAALGNIGLACQDRRQIERATLCFEKAEALYAKCGDRRGVAVSIGCRAHLARQEAHPVQALELFQDALTIFRDVGDPRGTANVLANLGHVLVLLGQPKAAIAQFAEALTLRRSLGNTLGVAECLEGFAAAAVFKRQARRAARLLGAGGGLRQITGASLPAGDREYFHSVVKAIRQQLPADVFVREQAVGRGYTLEQAIEYALQEEPARERGLGLTNREREVAELVARGLTNRQIAYALKLSGRTVGTHMEHIFGKLGFQGRAELAAWIARHPEPAHTADRRVTQPPAIPMVG